MSNLNLKGKFCKLTRSQQQKMFALIQAYPDFFRRGSVLLDTVALGVLWGCRSNDALLYLKSICRRLDNLLEIIPLTMTESINDRVELRPPNPLEQRKIARGGRGKHQDFRLVVKAGDKKD